jgi:hypothetical protein
VSLTDRAFLFAADARSLATPFGTVPPVGITRSAKARNHFKSAFDTPMIRAVSSGVGNGVLITTLLMTISILPRWLRRQSDFVGLDPAIQIAPIKMDPATSSYNDEFASVDQVLNRLLSAPDVGCGVFDREKTRGRFGFPVSIVNLRKDLCRELRRQLGYEEFVEHLWSSELLQFCIDTNKYTYTFAFFATPCNHKFRGPETPTADALDQNLRIAPGVPGTFEEGHSHWP